MSELPSKDILRKSIKQQVGRDRRQMIDHMCNGALLFNGPMMMIIGVALSSTWQQIAGAGLTAWAIVSIFNNWRAAGRRYDGFMKAFEEQDNG